MEPTDIELVYVHSLSAAYAGLRLSQKQNQPSVTEKEEIDDLITEFNSARKKIIHHLKNSPQKGGSLF